jgi:negative regulator of sigma-B (phosphoserine phosphatase)
MHNHGRLGPIEWATAGRPLPGEVFNGDQPIVVHVSGRAALFGVVDGLGHGPAAATVALRAVEVLRSHRDERLEVLLELCHRLLTGTRGAAITLARVDFDAGLLSWTGIGNVTANLAAKAATGVQVRSCARLSCGIVGYQIPDIAPAQRVSMRGGDLLVIATDGIAEDYLDNIDFAASAENIAEQILHKHSKQTDDALVLAARHRGPST